MKKLKNLLTIAVILVTAFVCVNANSAVVGDYVPSTDLQSIDRSDGKLVSNISGVTYIDGGYATIQNGGGRLIWRTDLADVSTNLRRETNALNLCRDIEGILNVNGELFIADEGNPATIYNIGHPSTLTNCRDALSSFTLSGMDAGDNRGIEGLSQLLPSDGGAMIAVKQSSPEKIVYFNYTGLESNYETFELFTLSSDCTDLGDVTVHPTSGNVLIICKGIKTIQEYTVDGALVSSLSISEFRQAEGLVFGPNEVLVVVGERNEVRVFVQSGTTNPDPDPVDPVLEDCEVTGTVQGVDVDNPVISGTLQVVCSSISGTIEVDSPLIGQ